MNEFYYDGQICVQKAIIDNCSDYNHAPNAECSICDINYTPFNIIKIGSLISEKSIIQNCSILDNTS